MPKIPLADKPGMIQHRRGTVPMTGAPGMNFNLEEGQALINLGRAVDNAGAKIGDAVNRTVSAREQFFLKQQYTQDRLAATEARNLYRNINADLENRMAENPAEFEKFKDWAAEADKSYANEVLTFTRKMSPEFRRQFDAEMKGVRAENLGRRTLIGIQAKITADYNLFQAQWKDAALRGDLDACNRMLDEHNGSLISQQEYEQKKLDFDRLAAFGEVKRLVEAGTPGIADKLKERDNEGHYTSFTGLDEASRDRFIRAAEANDAKKRSDENQQLLDRLNNGEQITVEDIDRFFDGQTAPEAVRQKNQQRRIVQQFAKAHAEAKKQAEREAAQEAREVEREKQKKRRAEINEHEYRILTYDFSPDPARRQIQYSELKNEILTKYPNDGATVKKLTTQLDESLNAKVKPDSSYKNSYIYIKAKYMLSDMEDEFYSRYPGRGKSWYNLFTNTYNNSSELEKTNYKMAEVQLDNFIRENPSATEQEVRAFLDNLKRDVNWAECDKLVQFWSSKRITPHISNISISSGAVERMVNGRIAIFGADKKFIRWKDGK